MAATKRSPARSGAKNSKEPAQVKRPLDPESFDRWRTIEAPQLLPTGWVLYLLASASGNKELRVRSVDGRKQYRIEEVLGAESDESTHTVVYLARDEAGATFLGIIDLAGGAQTRIDDVDSFEATAGQLVYLRAQRNGAPSAEGDRAGRGRALVARALASGDEHTFSDVVDYTLARNGRRLLYVTHAGGTVSLADLEQDRSTVLLDEAVSCCSLVLDAAGEQAAFLAAAGKGQAGETIYDLCLWHRRMKKAERLGKKLERSLPAGWSPLAASGTDEDLTFSQDGTRLFFSVTPPSLPAPGASPEVEVDIWHFQEPLLQSEQRHILSQGAPSYRAVLHLASRSVVLLEDEELPEVTVGADGNDALALGVSEAPYRLQASWEEPPRRDSYLVDVTTGDRRLVKSGTQGDVELSPQQSFAVWWNAEEKAWFGIDLASGSERNLTGGLSESFADEDWDLPGVPAPYGLAGWTRQGERVLLYDRYDIWTVDPRDGDCHCLTGREGRRRRWRFRRPECDVGAVVEEDDELLLHGFDESSKSTGFYRQSVMRDCPPETLIEADRQLELSATVGGRHLFTRSSVEEFPDLWVADGVFSSPRRLSDANPQQAEYIWATAELIEWPEPDGGLGRGLLYKPENFEGGVRYPLIVFVYERFSDHLHHHFTPAVLPQPVVNPLVYASRGYLVFIPDIHYRIGAPGESALAATVSGIRHLVEGGLVDEERIGGNSHSWGGYELAFMATRTDVFRAIAAGAPVANMTSSYCELRMENGRSRMFEYEQAQSRIGGTLWEKRREFLDNSPLLRAHHIDTPLLVLHNDRDGAVPWTEGLQLYLALRRLGKPCWLVTYNGEPHVLERPANRLDWAIRLQQFFDHYLMGATPPVWLARGVPARDKGRTLGLEPLIEEQE